MDTKGQFSDTDSFREQVLYVLSHLKKGSADEVAMELMELKGIASEEGVAELTIETEQELLRLMEEGKLQLVREKREKKRYSLKEVR
jgi:hypothetical protein